MTVAPKVLAVGDRADRMVSSGAIISSDDGLTWSSATDLFPVRAKALGISVGSTRTFIIGENGFISSSANLINWTSEKIQEGWYQPFGIASSDDLYLIAGQYKFPETTDNPYQYNQYDETAVIMCNLSDNTSWLSIYFHPIINSRFYNIRFFTELSIFVAVGSANNTPFGVYSLDYGSSWMLIEFPTDLNIKHAYDITVTDVNSEIKFFISVNGMILSTPSLVTPTWTISRSFIPTYGKDDFVKIASNPAGHIVAVSSGGIAYTRDQLAWDFLEQPGYRFKSVTWFNNRWIVGAESNLTQYTNWISADTVNWDPDYCGIQIYDFAIK